MSKERQKGTAAETAVCRYIAEHPAFPHVERRAMSGRNDRGDVAGIPGLVIEIKATREIDLGTGMREAETEARNAKCTAFALVNKRRMRPVADWYATVPLWLFLEMWAAYEGTLST